MAVSALQKAMTDLGPLVPWMPQELLEIYAGFWIESGDPTLALAQTQQDPVYEKYFPGNTRDDGSLRFTEQEYLSNLESYQNTLLTVNVNPDLFSSQFVALIEGDVSPSEFYDRVSAVNDRILLAAPEIAEEYARLNGLELSVEAMLAAALDPTVGDLILNKQISIAEIAGAASIHGFRLQAATASRLEEIGTSFDSAGESFAQGKELVPILDVLARRHSDPDDDFDIEEFVSATLLDDPQERRRLRRLLSQESSTFSRPNTFDSTGGQVAGIFDK